MNTYKNKILNKVISDINIIITDEYNNITHVSDHLLDLTGYDYDELIGQNPSIMKHPSSKFIFDDIWYNLNTHNYWKGTLKNIKKNGETFYVSAEIFKDFDSNNKHIGFHAIHTDITESIKNPHKFIFDNELFNLFFSGNDELITVCLCKSEHITSQKILEISNKLVSLLGIKKSDIINSSKSFTDIISKKSKYYQNQELLLSDYETKKEIIITLDTIEGLKQCRVTLTPFLFQGNLARIFKLTDITKEINYATELENINTSKNNFLANFSHEIRTPLNASIGFLTLLQLKETSKEKLDYIRIILDSSVHLLDLMNDVIDFTSIDNKKLEIIPREFTPKDLQSTIEIFYAKSLEKNIDLSIYISPQLPEIMKQDVLRIKQVISNLISNAIKFVNACGKITIDVHHQNNNLFFTITDDGIGMSENQLKNVFKPFVQASQDTKLIYGGTGLGLSVVNDIVTLMGGEITVDTKLKQGTTFIVKFPIEVIKPRKILGVLDIDTISIFNPLNTMDHSLDKYLMQFTNAHIEYVHDIDILTQISNELIIFYYDPMYLGFIETLAKKNKIILVKHLNELSITNNQNISEISLPILGSALFDGLNTVVNGISLKSNNLNDVLNLYIKGKILIADDLETNRVLLYDALSQFDLELDMVKNGKEALELYHKSIKNNKSSYNMVILDMNMPILSGMRTAAKIRDFENKLHIDRLPIITLTANRYYTTKDNKNLINMDEYITKPINLKQLLSTIIKYTVNIPIDLKLSNQHKFDKLKEIKDHFLKGSNDIDRIIINAKKIFKDDEYELVHKILDIKFNKRKFNILYNDLMKKLRKTND